MENISSITCPLDFSKNKNILDVIPQTSNTFKSLLFESPEVSTIKLLEPSDSSAKSLLHMLFEDPKEITDVEFSNLESYVSKLPDITRPTIETEEEKILLQIKLNYAKLNFLQAQQYLLNQYLQNFYNNAPDDAKIKYANESEFNFYKLNIDSKLAEKKSDPVKNFIEKFTDYTTTVSFEEVLKKHPHYFEVKNYLDVLNKRK